MPVILKINPQKRVVHSTFFGVVTDEEMLAHSHTIATHPDFRSEYDEIVDLSLITDLRVSTAAMQELAGRKSVFQSSAKHVIIAPTDFSFHRANELKRIAEASRPNLKVVRTAADAYAFVGVK